MKATPSKVYRFQVRLPEALHDRLGKCAEEHDRSMHREMMAALRQWVAQCAPEPATQPPSS